MNRINWDGGRRLAAWFCLVGLSRVPFVSACSISCATEFALGPHSLLEILVVIPVVAIVVFAFVQAVRFSLRPGEQMTDHIKWRILDECGMRPLAGSKESLECGMKVKE